MTPEQVMDALYEYIRRQIELRTPNVLVGTFVAEEAIDANLSQVLCNNQTFRYVAKIESVGTLTTGDTVLMIRWPGMPIHIYGHLVGDPTLATM